MKTHLRSIDILVKYYIVYKSSPSLIEEYGALDFEKLPPSLCKAAGAIYQDTCEHEVGDVIASSRFQDFAKEIKKLIPNVEDADIMRHLLIVYSEKIRDE